MAARKAKTQETETLSQPESPASVEQTATDTSAVSVVIGAYPGTGELMGRLWDLFHSGAHKVLEVESDRSLRDVFIEILKDTSIADRFTYTPANLIPCTAIDDATLRQTYVYMNRDGRREYSSRIPITADKDKVTEILLDESIKDDEAFARAIAGERRAMDVGFAFGNFITPVLRANPCENVVIEAFLRKFFVAASPEGFAAISGLVAKALLKE